MPQASPRRLRGAWPPLVIIIIGIIIMLLTQTTFVGAATPPRPTTLVARPAQITALPGRQVRMKLTVKRPRSREPALLEMVLPDGLLFAGVGRKDKGTRQRPRTDEPPQGLKRASDDVGSRKDRLSDDNSSNKNVFKVPATVLIGARGVRTLQWHLPRFSRRYRTVTLRFEVDFCGPPPELTVALQFKQGAHTAAATFMTYVDWTNPISLSDSSRYMGLTLLACQQVDPQRPERCLQCLGDNTGPWILDEDSGKCVCRPDTGTFMEAAISIPTGRWGTQPHAAGSCQRRLDPRIYTGDFGPLSCNYTNPRVLQAAYTNPAPCVCRPCPPGYISLGGPPELAVCFPDPDKSSTTQLQAFGIYFGISPVKEDGGRRRALLPQAEVSLLLAAERMASLFADILSTEPLYEIIGALEPVGQVQMDGHVRSLTPPSSTNPRRLFFARYTFEGSTQARNAVVESVNSAAGDLTLTCASWIERTGIDFCGRLASVTTSYELAQASAVVLELSDPGPFAPVTFLPVLLNSLFLFGTKAFAGIGKGVDQYRASKSSGKPMALEGKAMFVDSAFQILGMAFGFWNLFGGDGDKITPYLKQIDQTTKETLDRVKQVQAEIAVVQGQLDQISQQLDQMLAEVQEDKCLTANALVENEVSKITPLWSEYYDGESSVMGAAAGEVRNLLEFSFMDDAVANTMTAWATKVRTSVNVYAILGNMHRNLMGSGGVRGAVAACGQAFHTAWRVKKGIPVDDRQYYNPIMTYIADKIAQQAKGIRMVQDAYLILAMDAVRNRARIRNETLYVGAFAEPSNVCNLIIAAFNRNPASALAAGKSLCVDRSDLTAKIYNNIVQQLELMGMPLSNGDVGEGVRLLLGADITQGTAILVNNATDLANQTTYKTGTVRTRWLFPASLEAFDPRCANVYNITEAETAQCPALGTFRSCGSGCRLHPDREALWPRPGTHVLGYPAELWEVANGTAWEELRGLLTGWMGNDTATGDAADVLALLERPFPVPNVLPFAGMTNRSFWIVNRTVPVQISDLAIDVIPLFKTWASGKSTFSCDADGYQGPNDYRFPWYPRKMVWPQSQCFAAYNPTPYKGDKPRWAGATGVHCTSNDFAGIYKQLCIRPFPGCDGTHTFCNITLKPELRERFGPALLPSNGKMGNLSAACEWDQFWTTKTDQYEFFGGSCHLGRPRKEGQPAMEWACEGGNGHPTTYYRKSSPYRWRSDIACAPEFSYPWFPELMYRPSLDSQTSQKVEGWTNPSDSTTRLMYRLPVLDVTQIKCTPSPFVNSSGHDGVTPRPALNYNGLPTLCNDEMTQAVLSFVGPGDYEAKAGSSAAVLSLAPDNDTISCKVQWDTEATPGIYTTHVYITVRSGPVFDTDRLETTGDSSYPLWVSNQTDLYANSDDLVPPTPTLFNVSLRYALAANTSHWPTRVVGCTVIGQDPRTNLPVTISATSKVVLNGGFPWEDFSYPILTSPCLVAGCIGTVAKGLKSPSSLGVGPAVNLVGSPEAVFVYVEKEGGLDLLQILPNATTAIVYTTSIAFGGVLAWQVDALGRLYLVGMVDDGGYESPTPSIRVLHWLTTSDAFVTENVFKRYSLYRSFSCNHFAVKPAFNVFGKLISAWIDPITGDLYTKDRPCNRIYRVEAAALHPKCGEAPEYCGQIYPLVSLPKDGLYLYDFTMVSLVGDPARDILYVAYSGGLCGIGAFVLSTGAELGWVVAASKAGSPGQYEGRCGFGGDGGPALGPGVALSNEVGQLDVAPNGDLYIADTGNNRIRRLERSTGRLSTVVGDGMPRSVGDLGPGVEASVNRPVGVKFVVAADDAAVGGQRQYLYVTEVDRVRRILLN